MRGKKKAKLYLKFPNFVPPELLPLFPPRSAPPLSLRWLVVVFHFDLRFLRVTMERKKTCLMIFILNCTAVQREEKEREKERRLLSRRRLVSAAEWRKKE